MNAYTLSESAQRALGGARDEATSLGHEAIGAEHILLALLHQDLFAPALLRTLGVDLRLAEERLGTGGRKARGTSTATPPEADPATVGEAVPYTSHARRMVEIATREARDRNTALSAEHLLLAAMSEPRGTVAKLLNEAGVTPAQARAEVLRLVDGTAPAPSDEAQPAPSNEEAAERTARPAVRLESAPPASPAIEGEATAPVPTEAAPTERRREPREPRPPKPPKPERAEAKPPREPRDGRRERARGDREAADRPPEPASAQARRDRSAAREAREVRPEREERRQREREPASSSANGEPPPRKLLPHLEAARHSVWGPTWRRILLLAVPVSMVLGFVVHASPVLVFVTACLGVLPLAGLMGDATEHLAEKTGPTVGGLLNATFGNAAELIIALVALQAGKVELVKASITGSILGNLLLILGLALMAASMRRPDVRFNRTAAGMSAGMMALAVVGLVLPALFHATHPLGAQLEELYMSEGVSVVLIVTYLCSLLFSLKTHKDVFRSEGHALSGPAWPTGKAALVLALATVGVAIESELLVHAVEDVTRIVGIREAFLGLIIIPIIGNAAEHAAAIMVARKGQVDLGLQIALGSSTQIALLVAPVLVFAGVLMGQPMNLVFSGFEVMALGLATIVTSIIMLDGESHWFEGVQLLAVYAMIGVAAFFL
jgi:Ca2+:H+ antiporter